MTVREQLRRRAPLSAMLAWRRFKHRPQIAAWAKRPCFAEQPLDLEDLRLFRREFFPESGPLPWLDRANALDEVDRKLRSGEITDLEASLCRKWHRDGFVHLAGFFSPDFVQAAWEAVEKAVHDGTLSLVHGAKQDGGPYEDRFSNLHLQVPEVDDVLRHTGVLQILQLLFGRPAQPFHTLAFFAGSQQPAHSDSVHMTTYPLSYLIGTWTAMEDIHPESGPLVYYPGSHRWPFYSARDVGISERETLLDYQDAYNRKYEPFIQDIIQRREAKPQVFTPNQGDVLFWHANLLHGGTARQDPLRTRKSLVCHYTARDAICYHDISGSLARAD